MAGCLAACIRARHLKIPSLMLAEDCTQMSSLGQNAAQQACKWLHTACKEVHARQNMCRALTRQELHAQEYY